MEYHHRTWAPTNSSNVLIHTEGSEKSGFTALATVARDGQKFPLILVSKGTTVQSESNWFGSERSLNVRSNQIPEVLPNPYFNDTSSRFSSHETITPESLTDHSPKGWTNRTTWSNYLKALRYIFIKPIAGIGFYDVRNRIFLFIDAYRVHKCEEIIDLAAGLNIDVTIIPEGMTEVHQPLDIKPFGIMKAKARAFLTTRIANDVLSKYHEETRSFDGPIELPRAIKKREATVIIENVWDNIEEYQITEAWFEVIEKYFTTVNSDDDFSVVDQEFQTRLNKIA